MIGVEPAWMSSEPGVLSINSGRGWGGRATRKWRQETTTDAINLLFSGQTNGISLAGGHNFRSSDIDMAEFAA